MKLGERQSLITLYKRWVVILFLLGGIGGLSAYRYRADVSAMAPEDLLALRPEGAIRVFGNVKVGTLRQDDQGATTFELSSVSGGVTSVLVRYQGEPYESLREQKNLVIEGMWDTGKMEILARKLSLTPNYGFVTAAYLISLIPLGLFLFHMERQTLLLSIQIKEERGYEPIAPRV